MPPIKVELQCGLRPCVCLPPQQMQSHLLQPIMTASGLAVAVCLQCSLQRCPIHAPQWALAVVPQWMVSQVVRLTGSCTNASPQSKIWYRTRLLLVVCQCMATPAAGRTCTAIWEEVAHCSQDGTHQAASVTRVLCVQELALASTWRRLFFGLKVLLRQQLQCRQQHQLPPQCQFLEQEQPFQDQP